MSAGGQLVAQAVETIPKYAGGGGSKTGKSDLAVQAFYAADVDAMLALTYANKGSATSMVGTIRKKYPELTVRVGPHESGHAVYLSR